MRLLGILSQSTLNDSAQSAITTAGLDPAELGTQLHPGELATESGSDDCEDSDPSNFSLRMKICHINESR